MRGSGATRQRGSGTMDTVARIASAVRRMAGMPDYGAYLEHLSQAHPGRPALTEREHYAEYLRTRYGDGPTRCC